MKSELSKKPTLDEIISSSEVNFHAPLCNPIGDMPYGHLLGVEEDSEPTEIIFTDSVKSLYLANAKLD